MFGLPLVSVDLFAQPCLIRMVTGARDRAPRVLLGHGGAASATRDERAKVLVDVVWVEVVVLVTRAKNGCDMFLLL